MKPISIIVFCLLLGNVQGTNAQFLKKLKDKITKTESVIPTQKLSGLDQKFENWELGAATIVAISVFADAYEKHRKKIGVIQADGNFQLNFPDSLKTWVSVNSYGKDCENSEEAQIVNPETKLAWNQLHIFQDQEYLGAIIPANPVKAAYNLNESGVNNGRLGRYYLYVYANGNTSVSIACTKLREITDGKETTYPKMPLKDNFNLHYKKGWNIVEVNNLDNIWVGRTKHYTEREWKVVKELPGDVTWVFRPASNRN